MRISIVTPTFNQARFIERTIRSVLEQKGEFDLEYIVVDGGSNDGSLDILRRYDSRLRWISEKDNGQSDAINKGFRMASGDVLAWLNSDDTYEPGALSRVAETYRRTAFTWCFGNCRIVDEHDVEIRRWITRYKVQQSRRYSYNRLLRRDFIPQPATFFSRKALEGIGELDCGLVYSMDYDLWLKLGRERDPAYIDAWLATFRWHGRSKNGTAYRAAAWETYQTCRRHARPGERWNVFLHRIHVRLLCECYALYERLERVRA